MILLLQLGKLSKGKKKPLAKEFLKVFPALLVFLIQRNFVGFRKEKLIENSAFISFNLSFGPYLIWFCFLPLREERSHMDYRIIRPIVFHYFEHPHCRTAEGDGDDALYFSETPRILCGFAVTWRNSGFPKCHLSKYKDPLLNVRVQAPWFQIRFASDCAIRGGKHEDGCIAATPKWAFCGKQSQQSASPRFKSCIRAGRSVTDSWPKNTFLLPSPSWGSCSSTTFDCKCRNKSPR